MESSENNRKACPFLKADCLEEKCNLWATIQMVQVGPLGVARMAPASMCVFVAQLLVQGSPKPAPPQPIQIRDLRGNIGQG